MDDAIMISINGEQCAVEAGQTVAAVLLSRRQWRFGSSPAGRPRGPLCGMGICFECVVSVDGVADVRACLETVQQGMQVRTDA
ncbi:MAG TPA: (2Fe-2S)-binding protein [Gemmatimonadales bacterium]|jgi:sarcosine oxidase subunit alpha|nr:(2Fe-2S)-binding protein [Gemmatimonadales bacterium]